MKYHKNLNHNRPLEFFQHNRIIIPSNSGKQFAFKKSEDITKKMDHPPMKYHQHPNQTGSPTFLTQTEISYHQNTIFRDHKILPHIWALSSSEK